MKYLEGIKGVFDLKKWTDDAFLKSEVGAYSRPLNSRSYRGNGLGFFFGGADGSQHFFSWKDQNSSLRAYQECPPVTAIINRMAQAFINGKTWVLNTKKKEATTAEANRIRKIMERPNFMQSGKQFEAQAYIYTKIFGYCPVLIVKPVGFENDPLAISSMWNIPPFLLEIVETGNLFYQRDVKSVIKEMWLSYKGGRSKIDPANVFILKDFTPSFDTLILPESRTRALELPINNIIGAYQSRNTLINFRGAQGILSNEKEDDNGTVPMLPAEKDELQNDFSRYGLRRGQWQVIISDAKVKWQQMGYPTRDLMLFEEVVESTKSVCDGYNYPPHLLGLIDPTFNNQKEAEKGLYQNSIIPDAESFYGQWMRFFGMADMNLILDKDYAHIAALQVDKLAEAQARKTRNDALLIEFRNDLITVNRWLQLNDEDPRPDGEVYFSEWIKTRVDGMQGLNGSNNQNNNNGNQSANSGAR